MMVAHERTLPCRPRCCEYCDKRGFSVNPLEAFAVVYATAMGLVQNDHWMHNHCAIELRTASMIRSVRKLER